MELELNSFETVIKNYLDNLANEDRAFAKSYAKSNKSISECCKYIMQEVEKNRKGQKCVACTDEMVFGMAIHYYDEDDIKVDGPKAKVQTAVAETPKVTVKATKTTKPRKKTKKESAPVEVPEDLADYELEIPLF